MEGVRHRIGRPEGAGTGSEPFIDGCDEQGRFVTNGELVVSRGHCSMTLEAIDPALDRVARAVVLAVELRRTPTPGTELLAVADLVLLLRDGAADAASSQVGAVLPGAVCLVGTHFVGPFARTPQALAGHADTLQDRFELRGIAALPGCDHDRQGLLPLLDREMDLGGQPAPRASEPMVFRLGLDAAGRLLLEIPLFTAPAAC